ncbi:DUF3918 family protein [Ectobacillus polymachus]
MRKSMVAFGLGAAAYHLARRNNMFSSKNWKRARRKTFF